MAPLGMMVAQDPEERLIGGDSRLGSDEDSADTTIQGRQCPTRG